VPSKNFIFWFACFALVVLTTLALMVGNFPVSPADVAGTLWAKAGGARHAIPENVEAVIFAIRGPRIVAAVLIGAALAAAGAAYQGMFKNPLVSPDILGVSAGASLGAVIAIFLALPALAIQGFAFGGGLLAVAFVYLVGRAVRGHDPILSLILSGVAVGTLLGSGIALLKYLADPYNELPAITFWLLGSLATATPEEIGWLALFIVLSLTPLFLLRWRINVLALSDDEARTLGVNVNRLRIVVILAATLMTASAVAVSGMIGWIGLIIPHAARLLAGPEFSRMLPLSMLLGACFLLAVDTLARTVAPVELPPGVLTAFIGTPFFIWLLARSAGKES